jgi:hypothetical protein
MYLLPLEELAPPENMNLDIWSRIMLRSNIVRGCDIGQGACQLGKEKKM